MKTKEITICVIACLMAILSMTVVANYASNPDNHKSSIQMLDEKKENVLKLTALTTASSTAITLLPGDAATPIANELADLGKYFLLILCAVFLEKYLVTITGLAAFRILIPIAMICVILWAIVKRDLFMKIAVKLIVFSLLMYMTIPTSVKISGIIEETYQISLEETMLEAETFNKEINDAANEEGKNIEKSEENKEEDRSWLDQFKENVTDSFTKLTSLGREKITELTQRAEKSLNNFIEATAVMIVTSCIIPVIVLLFFVWLVKVLIGFDSLKTNEKKNSSL